MRVLALETSTPFLTLGWLEGAGESAERSVRVDRAHAERALPELEAFMHERGAERADLIAVGAGPGSYTGVRVGVSLALGLARGWGATVIGVNTLEAIAAQREGFVAVTLDARKGNVYSALYEVARPDALEVRLEPQKRALEAFRALVPEKAVWLEEVAPSGLALARLGLARVRRGASGVEISYL
jgi:tRNA threonylcarbamoyl adenosine modification protein YeaZ